jgi:predicted RecB family nuclease
MQITEQLIQSFLRCPYKLHLLLKGAVGQKSDYEILQDDLCSAYFSNVLQIDHGQPSIAKSRCSSKRMNLITGVHVAYADLSSFFQITAANDGISLLGGFYYSPVVVTHKNKIVKEDKALLAFRGLILERMQNRSPEYGLIIYGDPCKITKVKLAKHIIEIRRTIERVKAVIKAPPQLFINQHCQICEFKEICRGKAIRDENLSLLGQVGAKEALKKNKKGIFTLTQLSYTFRPRRRRKSPDNYKRPHSIALSAMAIRDKKVYVNGTPTIPQNMTQIYFDVEGTEEGAGFVYLVGLVVIEDGKIEEHSFWADTPNEEVDVFLKFVKIISHYDDYVLYHYGSYELSYLKRMKRKAGFVTQKIDKIIEKSFNLLTIFFHNVYMPTYTNGLKDIARYLGYQWSDEKASGIQSIVWRKRWEMNGMEQYKSKLIRYNLEDCHALLKVKNFVNDILPSETVGKDNNAECAVFVSDLKKRSIFKFCAGEFAFPEFEALNKFAQFDYQRERVHVRTNSYLKKYYAKSKIQKDRKKYKVTGTPNVSLPIPKKELCPHCNKISRRTRKALSKAVIDLKFSKSGVKRWITQLNSYLYYCYRCKKSFIPKWYKGVERKYGHDLMAWTMYQHVVKGQSFRQISTDLKELFGLTVEKSNTHIFKSYIMDYYQETFDTIGKKILNSPVLYVDETPINMRFESGYAWVMTNTEEVVSYYKSTREGEFIKEYLANYEGILVTDFYSAYDTLKCLQQKCLLHLMRDFNDDLLKNPFDDEFKAIAKSFTCVLQNIVVTIDKYGLKKRHLNKHNKQVAKFFDDVLSKDYISETARQYQKRLARNRDKLFLFLNHDNISWNNNAVEHAIKLLATHKNKNLAFFRESRMEEYLKIMSIYQTCKYKGVSFLKFMISREKDIDSYCGNFLRKRRIIPMLG